MRITMKMKWCSCDVYMITAYIPQDREQSFDRFWLVNDSGQLDSQASHDYAWLSLWRASSCEIWDIACQQHKEECLSRSPYRSSEWSVFYWAVTYRFKTQARYQWLVNFHCQNSLHQATNSCCKGKLKGIQNYQLMGRNWLAVSIHDAAKLYSQCCEQRFSSFLLEPYVNVIKSRQRLAKKLSCSRVHSPLVFSYLQNE